MRPWRVAATDRATLCLGAVVPSTVTEFGSPLCAFPAAACRVPQALEERRQSQQDGRSAMQCPVRPIHTSHVRQQTWALQTGRPWMCITTECRTVNPGKTPTCAACAAPKPVLRGWRCVGCSTKNHQGVKVCRQCHLPAVNSKDFWMCSSCGENNRIDVLDDNSRCGFCGYDMAPMTMTEMEAMRIQQERSEEVRRAQGDFDSISAAEADEQFGDPESGAHALPSQASASLRPPSAPSGKRLVVPSVASFTAKPQETRHTRVAPRRHSKPIVPVPEGPPGFDWMCRQPNCSTVNGGDDAMCSACNAKIEPEDWECLQCAAQNHLTRGACFNCRTPIPVSWNCSGCRTSTSIYDSTCRTCGTSRPPTEPKEVREVHAMQRSMSHSRGVRPRRSDWFCPSCNGQNFASRMACYQCGSQRPAVTESPLGSDDGSSGFVAQSHNNWHCVDCKASNFRTRTTCWQCGRAANPSATETWTADENTPVFEKEGFQPREAGSGDEDRQQGNAWDTKSKDDWVCGKCFTRNFKNRQECHKCGAVKTVASAPRRAFVRKAVKL